MSSVHTTLRSRDDSGPCTIMTRAIGTRARPYVVMVSMRAFLCGHPNVWPPKPGAHTRDCLATLGWTRAESVKAFKSLPAALKECVGVRRAWLDLTWPAPQVLTWHVVDIRDGGTYRPTRSIEEIVNESEQQGRPGRLF